MDTACYFWSESECKKGSCEIATGLFDFMKKKVQQGLNVFDLYCVGQNNNRMVFVMLSHAVIVLNIDSITLTFLVSGHSHSENDNAHSVIEKMARDKTV